MVVVAVAADVHVRVPVLVARVRVRVVDVRSATTPVVVFRASTPVDAFSDYNKSLFSNLIMANSIFKIGNHTPVHLFRTNATYMLTASIYDAENLMKADARKEEWRDSFHKAAEIYQWKIIAWVVLSNHYHAILRSPVDAGKSIDKFVGSYHKFTARKWNDEDSQTGRSVWWNYFDTCIKDKREFFAKLNYVHWNPVKHGCVKRPEDYPFSSYQNFMKCKALADQSLEFGKVQDVPEF